MLTRVSHLEMNKFGIGAMGSNKRAPCFPGGIRKTRRGVFGCKLSGIQNVLTTQLNILCRLKRIERITMKKAIQFFVLLNRAIESGTHHGHSR